MDGSSTSPEVKPPQERHVASPSAIDRAVRYFRMYRQNDTIREGVHGFFRTLINAGISAADFIPVGGEAPSWGADALKYVNVVTRKVGLRIDPTPDVPKWIASGSELVEIPTGTVAPSHLVETLMQLRADIPRMKAALQEVQRLQQEERTDYTSHKGEITAAMGAFGVPPPTVKGGSSHG